MRILFALSVILLCGTCICDFVTPGTPLYQYGITLKPDTNTYRTSFTTDNTPIYVFSVPCFGQYDWYVGVSPPNETVYLQRFLWSSDTNALSGFSSDRNFTGTVYTYFVSKTNYNGVAAQFDVIASTENPEDTVIPKINDRGISATLAKDRKSGTMSWKPSDGAQDEYHLYYRIGSATDGGYFPYTACGVAKWMQNYTAAEGTITKKDNGYSANVDSLDPSHPFTVTAVARRPGGYASSYNTISFNGAPALVYSNLLVLAGFAVYTILFI